MKETKRKIDWDLVGEYIFIIVFGIVLVCVFYGAIWRDELITKVFASIIIYFFIMFKGIGIFRTGELK